MAQKSNMYWKQLCTGLHSLVKSLQCSWKHLLAARKRRTPVGVESNTYFKQQEGTVTLQYPHERIPVPEHGRYKLHNEIEDCIVCDKCAKICPVNCIEIESIRSPTLIGKTTDGTPKRIYPARFDIDMAKCCFCGLCTTVCPTECLTMTSEYDFSVFDFSQHTISFSQMTAEDIALRKKAWNAHLEAKEAQKAREDPKA